MKIGVWNTAFLGDAVLTLPLLRLLSTVYPDALIHFWVREGLQPLFAAQPELTGVFEVAKRGEARGTRGLARLVSAVRAQNYDLWISAHRSARSGLVALLSRVGRRVGYDSPWYNRVCYTQTVDRAFCREPEIERLLRLAAPLLAPSIVAPRDPWPELILPATALEAAARFFDECVQAPVLALHPGSTWPTKRWTVAGFSRVASLALAQGAQVLLFGGPGEETIVKEIIAGIQPKKHAARLLNLAGALDLPCLAAYLARCDCYLGNDAGPLHLAWAQRVPVVALFGPTVRAHGFFPRGAQALVLERDLPCRPCGLHGSHVCPKGHHDCMAGIPHDAVWEAVRARLGV